MAMLAEPRQRRRYNLVPRGKALYEDDSRFGTKMLEKMGWKKGEGLGANSEGSKDFIRIRYKNDACGLGYEQRDDQWTEHEQSFNGLLSTLNNKENDTSKCKDNQEANDTDSLRAGFGFHNSTSNEETKISIGKMKEKISGISLEERSKQSKARVHYKKFTRGKDLAQYSEKDLANIFGKKAFDEEREVNAFYKNLNEVFGVITEETKDVSTNDSEEIPEKSKKKDKKKKKKDQESETEFSKDKTDTQPKTYTSSLSVQDYFKKKLEAIRNRKTAIDNEVTSHSIKNPSNDEHKEDLGKQKKKRKRESQDLENEEKFGVKTEELNLSTNSPEALPEKSSKKKDKKKKKKEQESGVVCENEFPEDSPDIQPKTYDVASYSTTNPASDEHNGLRKPKKKRKKEPQEYENDTFNESVGKKSKKQSDKVIEFVNEEGKEPEVVQKVKKCKKRKESNEFKQTESKIDDVVNKSFEVSNEQDSSFIKDNQSLDSSAKVKSKKSKKSRLEKQEVYENADNQEYVKSISKESVPKIENTTEECLPEPYKTSSKKTNSVGECLTGSGNNSDNGESEKSSKQKDLKESAERCLEVTKSERRKSKPNKGNDLLNENVRKTAVKLEESKIESAKIADVKESFSDVYLTQEPTKNKKDKKGTSDIIEIIDDSDKDDVERKEEKRKSKKQYSEKSEAEENETSEPVSSTKLCNQPTESIQKEVSFVKNQVFDLEELKQKYQAFDVLTISTFCAEKFRNINVNGFNGSTLPQIEGYGLSPDLQLDIQVNQNDEERISNLWRNAFNKYDQTVKPEKSYRSYLRDAFTAIKTKQRPPKLSIKSWQRKNVFQVV